MHRRRFLSAAAAAAAAAAGAVLPVGAARAAEDSFAFTVTLDKGAYQPGEEMVLTVVESIGARFMDVVDSADRLWIKRSDNGRVAIFTTTASNSAGTVQVTMTRLADRATSARTVSYRVETSGTPRDSRWPGHRPGRVYLGQSTPDFAAATQLFGAIGLRRTYYEWSTRGEDITIGGDHLANRLPWVSFKPPGGASSWRAVAGGRYDADIAARARRYAGYRKPVISTFHHEPTNDSDDGVAFAAAWIRIHDVMKREAGLDNVAFVPIIGDWDFNPRNRHGHPEDYLPDGVLERMPFLGTDCYQNVSGEHFDVRLRRILGWLSNRGVTEPMLGVGETGCCLAESQRPEEWFNASWRWVEQNPHRVGAVSYFNSSRNIRDGHVWALSETPAKMEAYRIALRSGAIAQL